MEINSLSKFALNDFHLPIKIDNDYEYMNDLFKKLDNYFIAVQKQSNCVSNEVLHNLDENINLLKCTLKYYYNADILNAQKAINTLIARYINNPFIVNEIDKCYAFRGIAPDYIPKGFNREVQKKSHYDEMNKFPLSFFKARKSTEPITERKDMLHIPFDKRDIVSTQRFSISGIPCLYLGTTSLVCWLELGQPSHEHTYYSSYKITGELKILNLCLQQNLIDGWCGTYKIIENNEVREKQIKNIYECIELFPLIIATSFVIKEENRLFKSEYIISQLVMQNVKSIGLDGVAYLSKKMPDCCSVFHGVNLAILATTDGNAQKYFDLGNHIELVSPKLFSDWDKISIGINESTYKSFCNYFFHNEDSKGNPNQSNLVFINGDIFDYTKTKYSQFDEYLLRQDFRNFEIS
jgi:hypothetical protein